MGCVDISILFVKWRITGSSHSLNGTITLLIISGSTLKINIIFVSVKYYIYIFKKKFFFEGLNEYFVKHYNVTYILNLQLKGYKVQSSHREDFFSPPPL